MHRHRRGFEPATDSWPQKYVDRVAVLEDALDKPGGMVTMFSTEATSGRFPITTAGTAASP